MYLPPEKSQKSMRSAAVPPATVHVQLLALIDTLYITTILRMLRELQAKLEGLEQSEINATDLIW